MLVIRRSQRHNRSLFQFVLHFRCHLHFLATATRLSLALQRRIFQKGSNCGGTQESNLSPRTKVASDGYIANDKSMPLSKKKSTSHKAKAKVKLASPTHAAEKKLFVNI
jgi:hypothetical protein